MITRTSLSIEACQRARFAPMLAPAIAILKYRLLFARQGILLRLKYHSLSPVFLIYEFPIIYPPAVHIGAFSMARISIARAA